MHPRSCYAENPPDFAALAAAYPALRPHVAPAGRRGGRPGLHWSRFDAQRQLTAALLHRDFGVAWWLPDGQLVPAVPNRANYVHWLQDLLALHPRPGAAPPPPPRPWPAWTSAPAPTASTLSWAPLSAAGASWRPVFGAPQRVQRGLVGDVTEVALEWAARNIASNPHLAHLIELRSACAGGQGQALPATAPLEAPAGPPTEDPRDPCLVDTTTGNKDPTDEERPSSSNALDTATCQKSFGRVACDSDEQEPVQLGKRKAEEIEQLVSADGSEACSSRMLVGVLLDGERFDFCMCNPPFFDNIDDAASNPRTACGGTAAEMVCEGGELAFITRMLQESLQLRHTIHWFTSMVGRKVNLKALKILLQENEVPTVRTTEFVQGRTSRWGIAWSFEPIVSLPRSPSSAHPTRQLSFTLQGVSKQQSAIGILKWLLEELRQLEVTCHLNADAFMIEGEGLCDPGPSVDASASTLVDTSQAVSAGKLGTRFKFSTTVFQQAPGTLLVTARLLGKIDGVGDSTAAATFHRKFNEAQVRVRRRIQDNVSQSCT
eukprot:SM000120S25722  [mRNA]  locus=s120:406552:410536:- [translate_table: standard]